MANSPVMCVRVPEDLQARLRDFCTQRSMSQSDAVRIALKVYMDRKVRRIMWQRIAQYENHRR